MDDDFNTPMAIAEMQLLAREINTAKAAGDANKAGQGAAELLQLGGRLGLLGLDPEAFLRKRAVKQAPAVVGAGGRMPDAENVAETGTEIGSGASLGDADIDRLIGERAAARKTRNFKESDRIRDLLAANNVVLEDQPGGKTLWRRS